MWIEITVLAVIVFALFILAYLFLVPIVSVTVNGFLLYLLFLRAYADITKRERVNIYAWSAGASFLITVLVHKLIPLWTVTTWALFTALLVYLYLRVTK